MTMKTSVIEFRRTERYTYYRDLSVTYEGASAQVPVRAPDLSTRGMFINISRRFPTGAVLKIKFYLTRTEFEVNGRAEVRYCLPGVGVGVEFVELSDEARRAIEEELSVLRQQNGAER